MANEREGWKERHQSGHIVIFAARQKLDDHHHVSSDPRFSEQIYTQVLLRNISFFTGVEILSDETLSCNKRRNAMKKNFFWIAVSMLMIILPTLVACANSSSPPDDPLDGTQWNRADQAIYL